MVCEGTCRAPRWKRDFAAVRKEHRKDDDVQS
jgi:hypothetical protein